MQNYTEDYIDFFRSRDETDEYPDRAVIRNIKIDPVYDIEALLDKNTQVKPKELFAKLQQDRISFEESILFLDYVFRKLLTPTNTDYFTAQEYTEIAGNNSAADTDLEEYTYLTYSCDKEQYKNRLRLKAYLDVVKNFALLDTPKSES